MRAIELAELGRAYGERVALAGLTLSLDEGQTLAVFGANGAGKTTLLRILATLLRPHRGVARVLGSELPREGWAVRGRIGELLEAVGLERRGDEPVHTFSRGMVQRLAVCRAVLHEPELLLLDEPLAGLDPGAAAAVQPLISGGTRVIISHDVEHGLAEADVVLGLRDGRPAVLAPAGQVEPRDVQALYA